MRTNEEIIRELTTKYNCDGIEDITAEKRGGVWILRLHAWDGAIFEMTVTDIKMRRADDFEDIHDLNEMYRQHVTACQAFLRELQQKED